MVNVASLILGQNGIWGDLLKVSSEGIDRIGGILRKYKTVRDERSEARPRLTRRSQPGKGRGGAI